MLIKKYIQICNKYKQIVDFIKADSFKMYKYNDYN